MPMNIIIQEKRKEIGLTQEQIGEYLGVSTPAVNKWEKGYTYPDISILPALARLLKIDLNTLLCFNDGLTEKEVNHFSREVSDKITTSGFEAGFKLSMAKIREYPNCHLLIYSIALILDGALLMYEATIEDKEPYKKQITALYERDANSNDYKIREKANYMLASKYIEESEYDKAHEVQRILTSLAEIETKEGNKQNALKLAEISQKVMNFFELGEMNAIAVPLHVAILQKNVEDSISLLKAYFSETFTLWDIRKAQLYRHIAIKLETAEAFKEEVLKEKQENVGKQVRRTLLYELENNSEYMFLHSNEEFQQLVEE